MYQFSIVHLRITYSMSRDKLMSWMEDARLDGDLLEVEAYQQVHAHGEAVMPRLDVPLTWSGPFC